jgi:glycosyltransferase involved in cell wall biosynthesis
MPVYYPHPVHFREAVDSILNQTLSDWELLIVEDPSPRSAAALLADLQDTRIRHLLQKRKGTIVDSLNRGLSEARASLVARADADDVCVPERLEKQVAYLGAHLEVDVLGSQLAIIDGEGRPRGYRSYPLSHDAIISNMTLYNAMAHPSVLFKKECVLAAGGYRRFFSEDYELWSRLVGRQAHFANHPEVLVRYRVIPQGVRRDKVRDTLLSTLEVKRLYWNDRMGVRGRLRMCAERLMLWLPAQLVLYVFMKTQYQSKPHGGLLGPRPTADSCRRSARRSE